MLILAVPTGTRSVSSLTPAQLARKRANDREAQRAIRARTKEHIDKLERTIDQLKAEKEDGFGKVLMERNRVLEEEIKNLTNQATAAGLPIHHSTSYLNRKKSSKLDLGTVANTRFSA